MAMLGNAALVMWWDLEPSVRGEFEHWHSHEHFRERLGIEGFLRASRWLQRDGPGVLQLYELRDHSILSSPAYLARLNQPTPWSTRMMPHHQHMIRSQCHVLESWGANVARCAVSVRLSAVPGQEHDMRLALRQLAQQLYDRAGCVGGHLLRHEAPNLQPTQEQQLRGGDQAADWIFLAMGYEQSAMLQLSQEALSAQALEKLGALPNASVGVYELSFSTTPEGVRAGLLTESMPAAARS